MDIYGNYGNIGGFEDEYGSQVILFAVLLVIIIGVLIFTVYKVKTYLMNKKKKLEMEKDIQNKPESVATIDQKTKK